MNIRSQSERGAFHLTLLVIVIAAFILAALIAVWFVLKKPDKSKAGLPECPGDGARIVMPGHAALSVIEQIPAVDPITDIPEFHDCQKFVLADGTYGARYAIFAVANLALVAESLQAEKHQPIAQRKARLAAVVYSWDGEYPTLGLGPGWNCLYMWGNLNRLWASVRPQGEYLYQCKELLNGPPHVDEILLELREAPEGSNYVPADYPPVARWDWDDSTKTQYISIKCAKTWCEIGRQAGFRSSAAMTAAVPIPPDQNFTAMPTVDTQDWSRTVEVRGWHDEQVLAIPAATPGELQPGPVRGVLIPHKALGLLNASSTFTPIPGRPWVPVAYAQMSGEYNSRLQFDAGLNTIFLCSGSKADCLPAGAVVPTKCASGTWTWWGKIESSPRAPRYTCVEQRLHANLNTNIPGTVRWRWDRNDETVWVRCTQGCCEMQ